MRLIFKDRVWFVRFVSIVKFLSLAQFSVDHLSYSFMPGLALLLCPLHSLIMRLTVSSLSPHKLHLLFLCVISIFAWYNWSLWHYLMLLLKRIQFLSSGFLLFSHVYGFLCAVSLVFRSKYPRSWFSSHFCFVDIFFVFLFYHKLFLLISILLDTEISFSLFFIIIIIIIIIIILL